MDANLIFKFLFPYSRAGDSCSLLSDVALFASEIY